MAGSVQTASECTIPVWWLDSKKRRRSYETMHVVDWQRPRRMHAASRPTWGSDAQEQPRTERLQIRTRAAFAATGLLRVRVRLLSRERFLIRYATLRERGFR